MFYVLSISFFFLSCRYIAVTQPIKYAKHKNSRRVCITIFLVWAISLAIGSPIVLGLNNSPNRTPDLCLFYNSDFIVLSSLSSFYIPCIIMVFLYWNIFKVSERELEIVCVCAMCAQCVMDAWREFDLVEVLSELCANACKFCTISDHSSF